MARSTRTVVSDDIDGSEGAETVTFAIEGRLYEVDLSEKNREAFHTALAPYVEAARRAGGISSRARTRTKDGPDLAAVRAWAAANGHAVSPRGRVPLTVLDAYANR